MSDCRKCSVCEAQDHHWIEECDDDHPEGVMACKHCPATRPITEADYDWLFDGANYDRSVSRSWEQKR